MFHLVSSDPDNYGTIKFRSSISSMNSVVMYRISSVSTIASFSATTPDDYMIIETTLDDEDVELTLHFPDHGAYELRTLSYYLNSLFEGELVPVDGDPPIQFTVSMDSSNRLIISADKDFTIKEATHNVKLLLGLYNTELPLQKNRSITMPSIPYISYGNILYLTARTDFVSTLNLDNKEITRSIAYKVNELLYPGYPIACKLPGNWSVIHSDQLSSLEFQLVDFQLVPVVLHAPLYITLEIQNLNNPNQTDLMNFIEM